MLRAPVLVASCVLPASGKHLQPLVLVDRQEMWVLPAAGLDVLASLVDSQSPPGRLRDRVQIPANMRGRIHERGLLQVTLVDNDVIQFFGSETLAAERQQDYQGFLQRRPLFMTHKWLKSINLRQNWKMLLRERLKWPSIGPVTPLWPSGLEYLHLIVEPKVVDGHPSF